jgi:Zn-dependent peptidase ImmA (M78 family)
VKKSDVELVHRIFSKVIDGVKNQYLAHIIRCMESYIRQKTGNLMFQINTFPLAPDSQVLNVGCAQYYPKRYFSIFFHPRMDEKQLRACLAHELGHLFIIELLNEGKNDGSQPLDNTTLTEPLSSIFGIFTIMDKNHFYKETAQNFNHHSWKEIVQAFVHLQEKTTN